MIALREAIEGYREFASSWSDVFLPELADSLHTLGVMLSAVGDHDGALQATREAVEIHRRVVAGQLR